MSQVLFVTGTDTGVGKTVVSSLIIGGLHRRRMHIAGVKPLESGCASGDDGTLIPADGVALWSAMDREGTLEDVVYWRMALPVSPAIAAKEEGVAIDLHDAAARIFDRSRSYDVVLVEGAGGLLSPLAGDETLVDLIERLNALRDEANEPPCATLVVVGSKLGALNHAALTFDALQRRQLVTFGYVLNDFRSSDSITDTPAVQRNEEALERVARGYEAPFLGRLEYGAQAEPKIERYLWPDARAIIDAVEWRLRTL